MRGWLCAKFVGLDFQEVLIKMKTDKTADETAKISPSNKLPCLHHNNLIIWDSLAIAEYLNEIFPEKELFPKDQKARALARSICREVHSGFPNLRSEMSIPNKPLVYLLYYYFYGRMRPPRLAGTPIPNKIY